jgi:PAS domain S-box-containing protein
MTGAAVPASDRAILDLLPVAVYTCDAEGLITQYNRKAAELWGREPRLGHADDVFCGAHRLFRPDGSPLPHEETPMADALRTGRSHRNIEVVIEQPSGRLVYGQVNIDPIKDAAGEITGAINCFQDITARKEAERNGSESESLLQGIVATTPECVKIVGRDGTLLHMNPAGLQMIEAESFDQVEGTPAPDMVVEEHRAHWLSQHGRVCDGEHLRWEFDIVGLRGTRRHMETHAAPLTLLDGTTAQLAITHDVTERRHTEDALRASETRFREILEALPNAVYTTDADGCITFYNQAAVEMSGRRPELGTDKWCVTWKLFRPDGTPLPHDECPMAVALKEQRPVRNVEAIAERPDGTRVPFIPYPTPLFDESGTLTGAVNMLVDISDRKKADENARLLASIVEFSDDAIISKNTSGIIQSWNKAAEHLFGYTAEQAIGNPVTMLMPPERENEEPRILERIRRGERIDHYETVRMRENGTLLDISLTVSPLKDANGKIVGASKIARDITERRRQEEHRQRLVNELNHRVKNTLATVQSIAAQTFLNRGDNAPFWQFERRLVALSMAHDVLTRESWEGADLCELVERTVAFIGGAPRQRVAMSGPPVRLRPKLALSLSLALHELCTNAAKYGALENAAGRVTITWHLSEAEPNSRLHLQWQEADGPPVEPPSYQGFGRRLLERALVRELRADVRLLFPPTGVICEIGVPLR